MPWVPEIWRRPLDAEFEIDRDYKLITGFALGYATSGDLIAFRAKRALRELLRANPATRAPSHLGIPHPGGNGPAVPDREKLAPTGRQDEAASG